MIVNLKEGCDALSSDYDVCVVGAGAAGIVLALELSRKSKVRVALLDSGGLEYDPSAQDSLRGETEGDRHPMLHRARYAGLGGATQLWAGWCRPLDEQDFERREWIDNSGWPIERSELDSYWEPATRWCGLGDKGFDQKDWRRLFQGESLAGEIVEDCLFRVRRFKFKDAYKEDLERSKEVTTFLHATVLRFDAGEGSRVNTAEIAVGDGKRASLTAKLFVLASGGLENPRLLLLSGETPERSLGNEYGNVGRYFTEHGFADPGWLRASQKRRLRRYFSVEHPDATSHGYARHTLSLTAAEQQKQQLANATLFFYPGYEASTAFENPSTKAALELWEIFKGQAVPGERARLMSEVARRPHQPLIAAWRKLLVTGDSRQDWRLRFYYETVPQRENRVELGRGTDRFGRPLGKLIWRLSGGDLGSAHRTLGLISDNFQSRGLGVLELPKEAEELRGRTESGKHPMGTTRMHASPRMGVVDEQCRVHGLDNLYVAGSSVFPAVGYANPTLTIVALAIRLADRLSCLIEKKEPFQ
ncbi:GMC family oxidoreductase [Pelagicoccus sp. SDUM812002]|uniref:GMC family oxidoreductase n=1 Tax=Pelagicoccus sp. SDUM812002 TaxID=3041266 RepID=UPI00280FDF07|nr:GMC family oxidoreductase [Pelagicoccus sp. SDUM812002]MDQ8186837.1 GMC family oxidoreductase [Pelagicoccus sp. SDUM812002]